ncbi:S4 domain-containing protein YaaA [Cohnella thailandensis]|jgi:S4 domain protein YaaA|uniref:S4 domain-containing protein YaaA n=1 Tax=Cohnella thailandensis TaxID=557557 RepID=A0A841SNK3_9BACL|nr:S4 domain-containing protein YaaA [Cohnella thailandensis]MBB6634033.1 S4 domain-containing protein YaaA [Cohnella thailandensis]MBP1972474.1 S4 domain protein YaaA [Cohnella thailandensis]
MKEIAISTEYITLGQVLKLGDCVGSGGEVKIFLQERSVTVNGQAENRRGRKLVPGDTIEVEGCGSFVVKTR